MIEKKSPKADLENKRGLFLEIGLVVVLALVLLGFEWKTYDKAKVEIFQRQATDIPEEMVEITKQETPPPQAPPPPQVTVLNIVEDNVEIDNDFTVDAEATQTTQVQEYVPVQKAEEEVIEEQEIFQVVESMPEFPGGEEARIAFLRDNIKYPQMARESGIQGTVYVTFVVETDGRVTAVRVLRGIGGGCDEEAVRVVKAMPRWIPGKQRGKPVRVQFTMPIKFTLQ